MSMRQKLAELHDVAGGDFNKLDAADRAAAVDLVFGSAAAYRSFLARYEALRRRGVALAEFAVTYGLPPDLTADDYDALDVAQPYGFALRVRLAAESAAVAAGGVGSVTYYSTYTDGDVKAATRMRNEALAREALR
jgi:hypothetical protein